MPVSSLNLDLKRERESPQLAAVFSSAIGSSICSLKRFQLAGKQDHTVKAAGEKLLPNAWAIGSEDAKQKKASLSWLSRAAFPRNIRGNP